jgi:hypothetical protein
MQLQQFTRKHPTASIRRTRGRLFSALPLRRKRIQQHCCLVLSNYTSCKLIDLTIKTIFRLTLWSKTFRSNFWSILTYKTQQALQSSHLRLRLTRQSRCLSTRANDVAPASPISIILLFKCINDSLVWTYIGR